MATDFLFMLQKACVEIALGGNSPPAIFLSVPSLEARQLMSYIQFGFGVVVSWVLIIELASASLESHIAISLWPCSEKGSSFFVCVDVVVPSFKMIFAAM